MSVEASPGAPGTAPAKAPLDEVMLAMDVVDTLRRRERLVKQELAAEGREQDLEERLRKIYAGQGIEVPDHVIAEGVAALKEGRFLYEPVTTGLGVRLARLYVARSLWGKWVLAGLAALILVLGLRYFLFVAPEAALPRDLAQAHARVTEVARTDPAREEAARFLAAGESALRGQDGDAARAALDSLEELRSDLEQEYELRIVNRPGERTGVWRIPDLNRNARNYYIIVEAVDTAGKRLEVPILNEETGKTERVSQWGLRVDLDTFERIAADKQDDGILERSLFGRKPRGHLEPEYEMPTAGGAITQW